MVLLEAGLRGRVGHRTVQCFAWHTDVGTVLQDPNPQDTNDRVCTRKLSNCVATLATGEIACSRYKATFKKAHPQPSIYCLLPASSFRKNLHAS
jgi:hypothetical protein